MKDYEKDNANVGLQDWIMERDRYILENNKHKYPWSTQGVFIIEYSCVATPADSGICFPVIVSLNKY